jgi:two-component system KDP operon response regulator KdpE
MIPQAQPQREGTGLIVDDEAQIRRVVRNALQGEMARIVEAATGREGIDLAAAERPILVVLDLGLPDIPGIEVCREIRKWSSAAIVVLSVRQSDTEKALLLDAGADDYVTKPFSTLELTARVRANLRRALAARHPSEHRIDIGGLVMDLAARTVRRGEQAIHLTPIEWELLRTFATQAGRTLTHRQLFNAVWGRTFGDPQQYLRVHVANLRRKIERDPVRPEVILTEPGVGYRLEMPG